MTSSATLIQNKMIIIENTIWQVAVKYVLDYCLRPMFYLMLLFIGSVFCYVFIFLTADQICIATLSAGCRSTLSFSKATRRRQHPRPSSAQSHHLATRTPGLPAPGGQPSPLATPRTVTHTPWALSPPPLRSWRWLEGAGCGLSRPWGQENSGGTSADCQQCLFAPFPAPGHAGQW